MNEPFPQLVGKVVSHFIVEHFDSGTAKGIKAVWVAFDDGSSIKLEFHIAMSVGIVGSNQLEIPNHIIMKGGGSNFE